MKSVFETLKRINGIEVTNANMAFMRMVAFGSKNPHIERAAPELHRPDKRILSDEVLPFAEAIYDYLLLTYPIYPIDAAFSDIDELRKVDEAQEHIHDLYFKDFDYEKYDCDDPFDNANLDLETSVYYRAQCPDNSETPAEKRNQIAEIRIVAERRDGFAEAMQTCIPEDMASVIEQINYGIFTNRKKLFLLYETMHNVFKEYQLYTNSTVAECLDQQDSNKEKTENLGLPEMIAKGKFDHIISAKLVPKIDEPDGDQIIAAAVITINNETDNKSGKLKRLSERIK